MIWIACCLHFVIAQADARRVVDLNIQDLNGNRHTLASLSARKGIVLFFLSTDCPVSNAYSSEYRRMAGKHTELAFFGIYPDPDLPVDAARAHGKEYRLEMPLILDPKHKIALATGVRVTPEAVLLKPSGEIVYSGRIDDRFTMQGKRRDEPRTRDLEVAIEDLMQGTLPRVRSQPAYGCPLPRLETIKDKKI